MMVSKSPTLVVLLLATAAVVVDVSTAYRNGNPMALNRRWWWFDSEEITEQPVPAQVQDVQDQVQVGQIQDQTSQDLVQVNQVQDQTSQDLVQVNQVQDQTSQDLVQDNQVQDQTSQDQDLDNIVQSAHLQEPVGQRWFWDSSVEDRSDELERQRQQLPARIGQTSGGLFWDSPLAGDRYYDSPEFYSNEFYTNELYSNELYDRSDEWRRPLIGSNGGGQRRPNQVRPIYGGPTQGRNPGGAHDLPSQGKPIQGRPTQVDQNKGFPTQGRIPGGAHDRPTQGGNHGRPNQGVQTPEPALAPYTGGVHADVSTAEPVNFDERHQGGPIWGAYVPPKK